MGHTDRRHSQTQEQYAATDLETMREARRYAEHVYGLFRQHIGSRVLEVGSGLGTFSTRLLEQAEVVFGVEPNPHCAGPLREALGRHPRFLLHECLLEECDREELTSHRFDTVVCVNVLEHIADDVAALRTFRDVLEPGGRVVIFVPAVQAAYGPLDAELGHHRRYSRASLSRAFAAAGLDLMVLRYTNPIGLIGWLYNARIARARTHSLTQVRLFERFVAPWALPLERLIPPPVGLSLVAVGRKPGRTERAGSTSEGESEGDI
jgi:2-polyprenyl-3-methyl-5-hydroxy-6-metoxy-1,4-benzoquinol methylase